MGPRGRCNLSGALRANISCFSPAPFLPTSRFSPVFARIFVRAGLTLPAPLLDASGKQLFTLTHVVTPLTATLPRAGAVWDAQRLERGRGSTGPTALCESAREARGIGEAEEREAGSVTWTTKPHGEANR